MENRITMGKVFTSGISEYPWKPSTEILRLWIPKPGVCQDSQYYNCKEINMSLHYKILYPLKALSFCSWYLASNLQNEEVLGKHP